MADDSGEHGKGDENNRSMSTRMDNVEDRLDVHDEDIIQLRVDIEEYLDTLDSRIRRIESGTVDVESVQDLYEYMLDLEERVSTLRARLEAELDEEIRDE